MQSNELENEWSCIRKLVQSNVEDQKLLLEKLTSNKSQTFVPVIQTTDWSAYDNLWKNSNNNTTDDTSSSPVQHNNSTVQQPLPSPLHRKALAIVPLPLDYNHIKSGTLSPKQQQQQQQKSFQILSPVKTVENPISAWKSIMTVKKQKPSAEYHKSLSKRAFQGLRWYNARRKQKAHLRQRAFLLYKRNALTKRFIEWELYKDCRVEESYRREYLIQKVRESSRQRFWGAWKEQYRVALAIRKSFKRQKELYTKIYYDGWKTYVVFTKQSRELARIRHRRLKRTVFRGWKDFLKIRRRKQMRMKEAIEHRLEKCIYRWYINARFRQKYQQTLAQADKCYGISLYVSVWQIWMTHTEEGRRIREAKMIFKQSLMRQFYIMLKRYWKLRQAKHLKRYRAQAFREKFLVTRYFLRMRSLVAEAKSISLAATAFRKKGLKRFAFKLLRQYFAQKLSARVYTSHINCKRLIHKWICYKARSQTQKQCSQILVQSLKLKSYKHHWTTWIASFTRAQSLHRAHKYYLRLLCNKVLKRWRRKLSYEKWFEEATDLSKAFHHKWTKSVFLKSWRQVIIDRKTREAMQEMALLLNRKTLLKIVFKNWDTWKNRTIHEAKLRQLALEHFKTNIVHKVWSEWKVAISIFKKEGLVENIVAARHYDKLILQRHLRKWNGVGAYNTLLSRRFKIVQALTRTYKRRYGIKKWYTYLQYKNQKHCIEQRAFDHYSQALLRKTLKSLLKLVSWSKKCNQLLMHVQSLKMLQWAEITFNCWKRFTAQKRQHNLICKKINRKTIRFSKVNALNAWMIEYCNHRGRIGRANEMYCENVFKSKQQVFRTWKRLYIVSRDMQNDCQEFRDQKVLVFLKRVLQSWSTVATFKIKVRIANTILSQRFQEDLCNNTWHCWRRRFEDRCEIRDAVSVIVMHFESLYVRLCIREWNSQATLLTLELRQDAIACATFDTSVTKKAFKHLWQYQQSCKKLQSALTHAELYYIRKFHKVIFDSWRWYSAHQRFCYQETVRADCHYANVILRKALEALTTYKASQQNKRLAKIHYLRKIFSFWTEGVVIQIWQRNAKNRACFYYISSTNRTVFQIWKNFTLLSIEEKKQDELASNFYKESLWRGTWYMLQDFVHLQKKGRRDKEMARSFCHQRVYEKVFQSWKTFYSNMVDDKVKDGMFSTDSLRLRYFEKLKRWRELESKRKFLIKEKEGRTLRTLFNFWYKLQQCRTGVNIISKTVSCHLITNSFTKWNKVCEIYKFAHKSLLQYSKTHLQQKTFGNWKLYALECKDRSDKGARNHMYHILKSAWKNWRAFRLIYKWTRNRLFRSRVQVLTLHFNGWVRHVDVTQFCNDLQVRYVHQVFRKWIVFIENKAIKLENAAIVREFRVTHFLQRVLFRWYDAVQVQKLISDFKQQCQFRVIRHVFSTWKIYCTTQQELPPPNLMKATSSSTAYIESIILYRHLRSMRNYLRVVFTKWHQHCMLQHEKRQLMQESVMALSIHPEIVYALNHTSIMRTRAFSTLQAYMKTKAQRREQHLLAISVWSFKKMEKCFIPWKIRTQYRLFRRYQTERAFEHWEAQQLRRFLTHWEDVVFTTSSCASSIVTSSTTIDEIFRRG